MSKYTILILALSLIALPLGGCFSAYFALYYGWLAATPLDESGRALVVDLCYLHLAIVAGCIVSWIGIFLVYIKVASKRDGSEI